MVVYMIKFRDQVDVVAQVPGLDRYGVALWGRWGETRGRGVRTVRHSLGSGPNRVKRALHKHTTNPICVIQKQHLTYLIPAVDGLLLGRAVVVACALEIGGMGPWGSSGSIGRLKLVSHTLSC